jgi:hypothetical protein
MVKAGLTKGPGMEELVRAYFLKAGYYVVRGVPFVYEGFDVTDVDLWMYGRSSSVSREIVIVDIKNKKTPQAIERIFWVHGLKTAVGARQAIVATTEKRNEVKAFGRKLGVVVLDGAFIGRLGKGETHAATRLADEELNSAIGDYELSKLDGDWRGRVAKCKSLLAEGLSFDNCNEWLTHARFFAEQVLTKPSQSRTALRCFYLICSFVAIAVDFQLRELSFLDTPQRSQALADGFTYGSKGRDGLKKLVELSLSLVSEYANGGKGIANQVKAKVEHQLAQIPSAILGEFFAKGDVSRNLFNTARDLEHLAMARPFSSHVSASADVKALLGCFFDYWGIDRVLMANASAADEPRPASHPTGANVDLLTPGPLGNP